MKILILGDIMGPPGRKAIKKNLSIIKKENSKEMSYIIYQFQKTKQKGKLFFLYYYEKTEAKLLGQHKINFF